jgi:hypothetical protein
LYHIKDYFDELKYLLYCIIDLLYYWQDILYVKEYCRRHGKDLFYDDDNGYPRAKDLFIRIYHLLVDREHGIRHAKDLFGRLDNGLGREEGFPGHEDLGINLRRSD